jgi:filamentous hemagglutinin
MYASEQQAEEAARFLNTNFNGIGNGNRNWFLTNPGMQSPAERLAASVSAPAPTPTGNVVELEVGTYRNLADRSLRDGLTPDHIPSVAAIRADVERQLGRPLSPAEARTLRDTTNAIVYRTQSHMDASRSYGGRNTPQQIQADSLNLQGAFQLDRQAIRPRLIQDGHSAQAVDQAFDRLDQLNRQVGRY